jgi:serine protease Do
MRAPGYDASKIATRRVADREGSVMATGKESGFDAIAAFSEQMATLVERVREGVVEVRSQRHGGGAGTTWDGSGSVVTNNHVVPHESAEVTLADGRSAVAPVVARDPHNDLAVLRVPLPALPALPVGDARALRPGELVFAVGHPFGVNRAVTVGVVSKALSRNGGQRELIRANVQIGPGNSGGPLADARGHVVGINAMVSGGLALAVPAHLVERLVASGQQPRTIGVEVRDVAFTPAVAAGAGLGSVEGVLVVNVAAGAPADLAGLLVGDVLTAVNGTRIEHAGDLRRALTEATGEAVRLSLLRGGVPHELTVIFAKPSEQQAA